jgi:hypothetical protein
MRRRHRPTRANAYPHSYHMRLQPHRWDLQLPNADLQSLIRGFFVVTSIQLIATVLATTSSEALFPPLFEITRICPILSEVVSVG